MAFASSSNIWPGLDIQFPATPYGVRDLLESLGEHLAPLQLGPEPLGDIEIVLAEVLNNVVEHAYGFQGDGMVELQMSRRGGLLTLEVRDTGVSMPDRRLPQKVCADTELSREHLPEGGFGWFLIHELVEELSYSRKDGHNVIRIGLRLG